ncbi:SprT family zinc-dependent metalloprotease [Clostridium sp.]|uniref:M48 family metallopeptidase n=1 Tax=Clostridium sp. TaxID=1506 RepID=UPI001D3627BD|nr:SprT family zinc-dependent metalloprotease [Clostridium sp.]MBS5987870.1 M48 family metallopeptidase [Clostridium sp.]
MSNIKYEVIYKNKKSISISIDIEGNIKVSVPNNTSDETIEKVIKSKSDWISKKIKEIKSREELEVNTIMYLGKKYSIEIIEQPFLKRNFVAFFNDKFVVNVIVKENAMKALEEYLKRETLRVVKEKVIRHKVLFDITPKDIKVKKLKSRWGSCSYDNVLVFNSKLIMFRSEAIDYVVIHELCHMIHKNHSKDYWDLVKNIMPNYEEEHMYLRENSHLSNIRLI